MKNNRLCTVSLFLSTQPRSSWKINKYSGVVVVVWSRIFLRTFKKKKRPENKYLFFRCVRVCFCLSVILVICFSSLSLLEFQIKSFFSKYISLLFSFRRKFIGWDWEFNWDQSDRIDDIETVRQREEKRKNAKLSQSIVRHWLKWRIDVVVDLLREYIVVHHGVNIECRIDLLRCPNNQRPRSREENRWIRKNSFFFPYRSVLDFRGD